MSLHNPHIIAKSPNRPNVKLCFSHVPEGPDALGWLCELLKNDRRLCPKTIVYCRRISDCSELYLYFEQQLGRNNTDLSKRYFDMMHSMTPTDIKNSIMTEFITDDSNLRIVIATKVMGMGIDVDCTYVVHYGPPTSIDDYVQQIGRAGCQGQQAHAILTYSNRQKINCDASILRLIKNSHRCYRQVALEDFGGLQIPILPKHLCCSFCTVSFLCNTCENDLSAFDVYNDHLSDSSDTEETAQTKTRLLDDSQMSNLKLHLLHLKDDLDKEIILSQTTVYMKLEILHGLSHSVIDCIVKQATLITSSDDLLRLCSITSCSTALQIAHLFSELFHDMDSDMAELDENLF